MNYSLYTDFYELTMAQGYFLTGIHERKAVFDYFFRSNPFQGGYVVFAGLETLLEALENFKFGTKEIDFLRKQNFDKEFLNYLENLRFEGNIYSVKEGEIVFPNEPLLRIETNLVQAQLIETLLLNILNFQSLVATKARRIVYASKNKAVLDFGMRRAQGLGALWASRAAIIGGCVATSNVLAAELYGISPSGTMAHSWIQSFESEYEAFKKYAEIYKSKTVLLLDTYNTLQSGLPNAIKIAKELEKEGEKLLAVRLDSGDLAFLSREVRKQLDNAGLDYVKIAVSNKLDEYIIKSLNEQGAKIDLYGVGTKLVTAFPDGALDGVYKLSEIEGLPTMKLSDNPEKTTLPGKKKIIRFYNGSEQFYGDAIVLDVENPPEKYFHPHYPEKFKLVRGLPHEELLQPQIVNGERSSKKLSVTEIAEFSEKRFHQLPEEMKRFDFPHVYKVGISSKLMGLRNKLKLELNGRR